MSQENVEVVRRAFEAYVRGDLETSLAAFDPEVETYDHDLPDAGEYRGVEGLLRWQADWDREWESWRWEPKEYTRGGAIKKFARGAKSRSAPRVLRDGSQCEEPDCCVCIPWLEGHSLRASASYRLEVAL